MSFRSQSSLFIMLATLFYASNALGTPAGVAAPRIPMANEPDGATSALRTQSLSLPTTETAPTTRVAVVENSGATTTDIKTASNAAAIIAPNTANPVPPMGSPVVGTTNTTESPLATTTNPLEGITSPLYTAPKADEAKKSSPLDLGKEEPLSVTQSLAVVGLSLAGLALFGLSLVRYRNRSTNGAVKADKPMQILTTLPLSPKRQLIMVRIRDQEIVLASTEQGVTMLTEVASAQPRPLLRAHEMAQESRETMARLLPSREIEERAATEAKTDKSEMILKALNGIKEKKTTKKQIQEEPAVVEPKVSATKGTKAAFPKYLANAFQQEAKRELSRQKEMPVASEDDSVENVTRMIREKLKTMQPSGT